MIGKIIKISDELLNSPEGDDLRGYSYNLPLFGTNLNQAYQKEFSEYVLQLGQINHGARYPTGIPFINEDNVKVINAYLDWVIKNNLDDFEFLI